jgi:RimJ/RimL family protein N-acetyltransferase
MALLRNGEAMASLRIRPLCHDDIDFVVRYWTDATPDDLRRMGVDPGRVGSASSFREPLEEWLRTPPEAMTFFPTVWLVDDAPVGYATLKDLRRGKDGSLHLHVWAESMRGRGFGAPLFCLTAIALYDRFRLETLRCEPKADNPYPNRMLATVGFARVGTRRGRSSELSDEVTLATYRIDRDVAERFLRSYERSADGGLIA